MQKKIKKVYLDYAATTPVDPRVMKAMLPYFTKKFGNTMSLHNLGQEAMEALENSRATIATLIGAKLDEVIFTSSATESNNLALKGVAFANKEKGRHIIISSIEHPCIIESARWLAKEGFKITKLRVDKYGFVDPDELKKAIKKDTILVSVMHANNEIGTIEPVEEIGKICRERKIYFHTDAVQTLGKIEINVDKMNIDLLSASSHKIYGPKGVGFLYVRSGVKIYPLLHGGGQEFGLRSSTVNLAGIVGFATACEICKREMKRETEKMENLRDKLIKSVLSKIEQIKLNGHPKKRLPNNAHFSFLGIEGESLVFKLSNMGVFVSTGSACSSRKLEPSHVLLAIGLTPFEAHGSLRMSLGRWTKDEDITYTISSLVKIVNELRKISPFKICKK